MMTLHAEKDDKLFKPTRRPLTNVESIISMVCMAVGTGSCKMGAAYKCGAVLGPILTVIMGLFALYGFQLYLKAAAKTRCATMEEIASVSLGSFAGDICAIFSVGSTVLVLSYYIDFIVSSTSSLLSMFDSLPSILNETYSLIVILLILVLLPLCMNRSVKVVAYMMEIKLVILIYLFFLYVYNFITLIRRNGFDPHHQMAFFRFDSTIIDALGSLSTAFLIYPLAFPGFHHFGNTTHKNLSKSVTIMHLSIGALYIVQGLIQYMTLFDENEGGLIFDYFEMTPIIISGHIALILMMALTTQMVLNPARYVLLLVTTQIDIALQGQFWVYAGVVIAFLACYLTTMTEEPIATLLGIICDGFSAILLGIIPGVLYLATHRPAPIVHLVGSITLILAGLGVTCFLICLYFL